MFFLIPWALFVIPTVLLVVAWSKVIRQWRDGPRSNAGIASLTLASASVLLGFSSLTWGEFVRPIPPFDYPLEGWGMCLTFSSVITALAVRQKNRHRYFGLSLAAAAWLFALFFIAGSTY